MKKDIHPEYHNVKHKVKATSERKTRMVAKALEHAKANELHYNDIDGVRIDMKDSWIIVRPSGTEEYVRIFAEAKTPEKAKQLVDEYEKIVKN